MSSGSIDDRAVGNGGELPRRPEKRGEQHHEGLADVLLCDEPPLFYGLFHDAADIRLTKDR